MTAHDSYLATKTANCRCFCSISSEDAAGNSIRILVLRNHDFGKELSDFATLENIEILK